MAKDKFVFPRSGTNALHDFLKEYHVNMRYVGFISHLSLRTDEMREAARRALNNEPSLTEEELFKHASSHGIVTKQLRNYAEIICENLLCRNVENFLSYISDILRVVFIRKPETLKSSETITLEEAFSFSSMKDLIKYVTDKKVNELSYQGLVSIAEHIKKRFGIDLFPDETRKRTIVFCIECRNIIIHNRSVVNEIFLKRTKSNQHKLGQKIALNIDNCIKFSEEIASSTILIDNVIALKFKIKKKSFLKK